MFVILFNLLVVEIVSTSKIKGQMMHVLVRRTLKVTPEQQTALNKSLNKIVNVMESISRIVIQMIPTL